MLGETFSVSAQSKKEQILILKGKIDSLKDENLRIMQYLEVSQRLENRSNHEIDSLKNVLNIQEGKLNTNKVSYENKLRQLQHELDIANYSLKKRKRDLDSIASLPENSIALTDSSRLAYFTKYLVSPNQTVSSGVLGDLNSDGYVDMVLVLQDTTLGKGDYYESFIYKAPIIINIYFWNRQTNKFVLQCSNMKLFEFWDLAQGESVDLEIKHGQIFLDHLGASGSHQQREKVYISYNKKLHGFFFDSYYYGEVLFRDSSEDYDYELDFKSHIMRKSNLAVTRMNISPPSFENFPDENWNKAMKLIN